MYEKIVSELKELDSDKKLTLTLKIGENGLTEVNYISGEWSGKVYSIKATSVWKSSELVSEMQISDVINLLSSKKLNEMIASDFSELEITDANDGEITVTEVKWNEPLTEEELKKAPSDDEMYWDGLIDDEFIGFYAGSLISLNINDDLDYNVTI